VQHFWGVTVHKTVRPSVLTSRFIQQEERKLNIKLP